MLRNATLAVLSTLVLCGAVAADDNRMVDEFEVEAHVDKVWEAFTTTGGLKSWVAPLADIDFRVGGKWRANYNKDGELGDATTIENTILSYDPKRMLSIKATGFPKGFPFEEAARQTWSVFYFTKVSDTKTKVTTVGLGYTDSEQSQKMRSYFKTANRYTAGKLKAALEKKSPAQDSKDAK